MSPQSAQWASTRWLGAMFVATNLVVAGHASTPNNPRPRPPSDVALSALWEEPHDLSTRDLFNGPWGAADAPDVGAVYHFVRQKTRGTSPGIVVSDPRGRLWHVKQGREASPEVVVSRILSAVGYHQPPLYFVRSFMVETPQGLIRQPPGRFRLAKKSYKAQGEWEWAHNPFVGTKPHQGLLVMLVLLNSADLKTSNNRIYVLKGAEGVERRRYVVRDLGTSLGSTRRFDPPPSKVVVFERQPFITGISDGFVTFDYRAVHNSLVGRITPDDVRWASAWLAALSDTQWHDAFRAGGYSNDIADRFIRRIKQKVQQGLNLR